MKSKWRIPHPGTMFFLLTLAVIFLSWIFDIYGMLVRLPQSGEVIRVQSLLSPEGIRWLLRNAITNFTGFAPLGMVTIALFGVGVAQHSGFIEACIRRGVRSRQEKRKIILWVIALGLLSNIVGDAGYIILLPIAATLFQSVGLHPMAGIIAAYASVSCGYSANVVLSTLDPLLARTTQEAMQGTTSQGSTGPLCNYYLMFVATFVIAAIIYWVTRRSLIPALGVYEVKGSNYEETAMSSASPSPNPHLTSVAGNSEHTPSFVAYKQLSRKERRALTVAVIVAFCYITLVLWLTFSSFGILRGVSGGLINSPFIEGILFIISLGFGLTGMAYGFSSGRYRTDDDVIEGLAQPMKLLGVYFVIAFFAAQMFACFEYSRLDQCLAIWGANLLSSVDLGLTHASFASDLPIGALPVLVLFILFSAAVNLIMVSATSKWTFMAFIFVPLFARMGISPDMTQCAFRIGDSSTNAIAPFMFYLPLVLTYMRQYDKRSTYGSLLKYTWRYSVYILLAWTILFIFWYLTGLPLGL